MNPRTHDVGAYIDARKTINPTNATPQTIAGAAIDRTGFYSCVLHGACGAASGSPSAQSVIHKLQDSADGSTGWNDFAPAVAPALTADNAEVELDVDLAGAKRFIRGVAVVALTGGSTPAIPVAQTLVLGGSDTLDV